EADGGGDLRRGLAWGAVQEDLAAAQGEGVGGAQALAQGLPLGVSQGPDEQWCFHPVSIAAQLQSQRQLLDPALGRGADSFRGQLRPGWRSDRCKRSATRVNTNSGDPRPLPRALRRKTGGERLPVSLRWGGVTPRLQSIRPACRLPRTNRTTPALRLNSG